MKTTTTTTTTVTISVSNKLPGIAEIDVDAKTNELYQHLLKSRLVGLRQTYSNCANKLGVHYRTVEPLLGRIYKMCKNGGHPLLNSWAVNAGTGEVGGSWNNNNLHTTPGAERTASTFYNHYPKQFV